MYPKAPLSARRKIKIKTTNFEPTINNFLKEAIKFEAPPDNKEVEKIKDPIEDMKSGRRKVPNGSIPRTAEEMRAGRRRAFERAHQMQCEKALKSAERAWKDQNKYRDWKTKQTFKALEPRRYAEDQHVLEDIVHERNGYYLDSIGAIDQGRQNVITNLRTLPRELRTHSQASKPSFCWS